MPAKAHGVWVGKKAYNLGALEMSTTLQPSPPFFVLVVMWYESVLFSLAPEGQC